MKKLRVLFARGAIFLILTLPKGQALPGGQALSSGQAVSGAGLAGQQANPNSIHPKTPDGPDSPDWTITWFPQDVDTTSGRGRHNSLAIASDGYPHIAYIDETNENLLYATQDASGWQRWILDGHDPAERIGWGTALVLDAEDDPHILYFGAHDVRYMYTSGGGWYRESILADLIADGGDINRDSSGAVYASFHEALTDHLVYAERDSASGSWEVVVVDSSLSPGHNTGLVVDTYGGRAISYSRYESPALLFTHSWDGQSWDTYVIDSDVGAVATHTDLAMAVGGGYSICYFDAAEFSYTLKVAQGSGTVWDIQVIDENVTVETDGVEVTSECSLAYDAEGDLHLAYHDGGALRYAIQDQAGWHSGYTIENWTVNEEPAGRHNDLAIGLDGDPRVSYDYTYSPTLKYAEAGFFYPLLQGDTACAYGSRDCNRCAYNVVESVARLSTYGEILGFYMGDHPETSFDWTTGDFHGHWQGLQRLSLLGGDYLVLSHDDMKYTDGDWSGLGIVRMDTRAGDGLRWRSNRLEWDLDFADTPPLDGDIIAHTVRITNEYDHPGGFQTLGEYLVVGTDRQVHLYDLGSPEAPAYLGQILDRPGLTSSTTSLAKLQDGHYLMAVSNSDADPLDFYFSDQPGSLSGFSYFDTFYPGEQTGGDWHAYQNMNLVTECGTGDLYLIGTYNGGWLGAPTGEDRAVVYSIDVDITGDIQLDQQLSKQFDCAFHGGETHCNFDAAAGLYVDPDGQIILYSSEHDNEGPQGHDVRGTVKLKEFRPVPHNASCTSITEGWVELYRDPDYEDWNLMIDMPDAHLENWSNYDQVEDFEDRTSSVRWCLPESWVYVLYQDKEPCEGRTVRLYGTGVPMRIHDLADALDFGDRTSCSALEQEFPVTATWGPSTWETLTYTRGDSVAIWLEPNPGSVGGVTMVVYTPANPPEEVDDYLRSGGVTYALSTPDTLATAPGAHPLAQTAFDAPVEVRLEYDPRDVEGLFEDTLDLYVYNEADQAWQPSSQAGCAGGVARTLNADENWLETQLCLTGDYALLGVKEYNLFLPNTLVRAAGPRRVLVDEAHGNALSLDWARAQQIALDWGGEPEWVYLGELRARLADEFSLERNADQPLSAALLADYDVLVLPHYYDPPLSAAEVSAVQAFVASGKGLIVAGECGWDPPNPELVSPYGLAFEPSCIFNSPPLLDGNLELTHLSSHPGVSGVTHLTYNWAQSLDIWGPAQWLVDTVGVSAWQDTNHNDAYDPGIDALGPFIAAAASDAAASADAGAGRVVAYADSAIADSMLGWTENDVFFRAILRWVSGGQT